jgi:uncharacterized repeat protein (TIGR01451 family)
MKRILIRISALAMLLASAFIAIAHAQRGPREEPAADTAAASDSPLRGLGTDQPQMLPDGVYANPLRNPKRRFPGDGVRTTAATEEIVSGPRLAPAKASTPEAPPAAPVADPFARPRIAAPAETPAEASHPRSAFVNQEVPANPQAATAAPNAMVAPPAEGAYPRGATLSAMKSREPAPFQLDASAPSGSIPRASSALPASVPSGVAPERFETARENDATGRPGEQQLEGPQSPQLTLEKIAPREVQVGKTAVFRIKLRNTGPIAAHEVQLRDEVPKGTRLLSTQPRASRGVRGELVWALGTVKPGEEVVVEVELAPIDEGEIGSVATVSFNADASAKTVATRPQLVIKATAPNRVLIGEDVKLSIVVSNPGSGIAQKVVLEERVPPGLQHPAGSDLEYDIGDLRPNESRRLELTLKAAQPGQVANLLSAHGEANLKAEDRLDIEVLAPQLNVTVDGPKRRYLERAATYTLSVSNPGTAPARQVQLLAELPPGFKFVSANNAGRYDEQTRTVQWLLEELPIKETGTVSVTAIPVEIGEQTLRLRGTAERGLSVEKEQPVLVEGIAALMFEVRGTNAAIELNGETTYEIHVRNQGSKAATNVQISADVPAELRLIAAEGPSRHTNDSGRIAFEPLPRLAPKADAAYRLRVQGVRPGDLRVRVQLKADDTRMPITKEESTRVYAEE